MTRIFDRVRIGCNGAAAESEAEMKTAIALLAIAVTFVITAIPALATRTPHGTTFITDTLGGDGHPARIHNSRAASLYQNTGSASAARQGYTTGGPAPAHSRPAPGTSFITDTLGGNGGAPSVQTADGARGQAFSWPDAGVGGAMTGGTLIALVGAVLLVSRRRNRLAT